MSLYKLMGKERADKYLRRSCGGTKPVIVEGVLPAAERVTTGETPVAISLFEIRHRLRPKGRAARLRAAWTRCSATATPSP